jgi:methylated-DNA-[protein]-cysteine S-methyltransferase
MTHPSLHTTRPLTRPAPLPGKGGQNNAVDSLATASYGELPWGPARVVIGPLGLVALDLRPPFDADYPTARASDPMHRAVHAQLRAYARRRLTSFSLPLDPQGTPFQRTVWAALLKIPCGETRTAGRSRQPSVTRGRARGRDGVPDEPHQPDYSMPPRGQAGGALTGYAGGLDLKARLLRHEGVQ